MDEITMDEITTLHTPCDSEVTEVELVKAIGPAGRVGTAGLQHPPAHELSAFAAAVKRSPNRLHDTPAEVGCFSPNHPAGLVGAHR